MILAVVGCRVSVYGEVYMHCTLHHDDSALAFVRFSAGPSSFRFQVFSFQVLSFQVFSFQFSVFGDGKSAARFALKTRPLSVRRSAGVY